MGSATSHVHVMTGTSGYVFLNVHTNMSFMP